MTEDLEKLFASKKEVYRFTETRIVTWDEIDAYCASLKPAVEGNDLIIGILRYGAPIATLLARHTNLPLDFVLLSDRVTEPTWLGDDVNFPVGKRLLLVDDTCGTGYTLKRLTQFFSEKQNTVSTLSMFYCRDWHKPDLGMPISEKTFILWPWHYGRDDTMPI